VIQPGLAGRVAGSWPVGRFVMERFERVIAGEMAS
jgi:hypothetical protein